jgi:hypothetical protein
MAVVTHTCYTLTCDNCGNTIETEEYEGTTNVVHLDSPEEARAALVGDPDEENEDSNACLDGQHLDGRDLCGECNTKRICAKRGHRWTDWADCLCRGTDGIRTPRLPAVAVLRPAALL